VTKSVLNIIELETSQEELAMHNRMWLLVIIIAVIYSVQGFTSQAPITSLNRHAFVSMTQAPSLPAPKNVGVVLLAGGKGTRMKAAMPKQFLPLLGKPVFLRSLDVFQRDMPKDCVSSIVIVLDESFRDEYQHIVDADKRILWADPGKERQDSVFNGLNRIPDSCSVVAIHDAARPLVSVDEVTRCLQDGIEHGAAVLGVPMKATVKESKDGEFVLRTVPRSRLWEIHTPQVGSKALFFRGFKKVRDDGLEVTDDASVVEALGEPVKLTLGEYTNIKLTTPDDLSMAEQILRERGVRDDSKWKAAKAEKKKGGSGSTETKLPSVDYGESLEKPKRHIGAF
jgi:2-C-methyl-D-erythritol 4-phosphate cytidylyltransferase